MRRPRLIGLVTVVPSSDGIVHQQPQTEGGSMSEHETALYTAVYDSISPALADLDAIEELHKDEMIGKYDAAVIDQEQGKPHIVKRVDHPRMRIIPETLGFGALPRKELKEAAQELSEGEAGLIMVGEPTIEKGFDQAVRGAAKIVKRQVDATADEICDALQEAAKQ
jgi:hypothetical protein